MSYCYHINTVSVTNEDIITVAEVKSLLRLQHAQDDAYLQLLIASGLQYAEYVTRRSLIHYVLELTATGDIPHALILPRGPIITVDKVTAGYISGSSATMPSSTYSFEMWRDRVVFDFDVAALQQVTVRYQSGYAEAARLPAPIRLAIIEWIIAKYDNKETKSLENQLGSYRQLRV